MAAVTAESTVAPLTKNIKTPDPIPAEGCKRALEIMESGRLYRYNLDKAEDSEVALVERDLAGYTGHRYCVGLNSCGSAIFLSLKCVGVGFGDKVLSNVFTFAAVPSAIAHAGGEPVYVNCTDGYVVDPGDFERKAAASGARFAVISHMRGKVADMDAIKAVCDKRGIIMVEDCAHSLGVRFGGRHTGHHGVMASFSTQSYKMLNSGEGGFLVTDNDELAAKAMCYSGSYEQLYKKHLAAPPAEVIEAVRHSTPNFSLRMHEVTAAMLRPQIRTLDERIDVYNKRYHNVCKRLDAHPNVSVPVQLQQVDIVGDSVQFNLMNLPDAAVSILCDKCKAHGVPIEIFGADSNARNFKNWHFAIQAVDCDESLAVIRRAVDMRLPLLFEDADVDVMVDVVLFSIDYAVKQMQGVTQGGA